MSYGTVVVPLIATAGTVLLLAARLRKGKLETDSKKSRSSLALTSVVIEVLLPVTVAAWAFTVIALVLAIAKVASLPIGAYYAVRGVRESVLDVVNLVKPSPLVALVSIAACYLPLILRWNRGRRLPGQLKAYRKWIGRVAGFVAACAYFTLFGPAIGQANFDVQPRIEAVEAQFAQLRLEVHLALAREAADSLVAVTIASSPPAVREALIRADSLAASRLELARRYDTIRWQLPSPLAQVEQVLGRVESRQRPANGHPEVPVQREAFPRRNLKPPTSVTLAQIQAVRQNFSLGLSGGEVTAERVALTTEVSREVASTLAETVVTAITEHLPLDEIRVRGEKLVSQLPIARLIFTALGKVIEEVGLAPQLERGTDRLTTRLLASREPVVPGPEIRNEVTLLGIRPGLVEPTPAELIESRKVTVRQLRAVKRGTFEVARAEVAARQLRAAKDAAAAREAFLADIAERTTRLDNLWSHGVIAAGVIFHEQTAARSASSTEAASVLRKIALQGDVPRHSFLRRLARMPLKDRDIVLDYLLQVAGHFELGLDRAAALTLGASGRAVPRAKRASSGGVLDLEELGQAIQEARQAANSWDVPNREARLLLDPAQPELRPLLVRTNPLRNSLRDPGRLGATRRAREPAVPEQTILPPTPSSPIPTPPARSDPFLDLVERHVKRIIAEQPSRVVAGGQGRGLRPLGPIDPRDIAEGLGRRLPDRVPKGPRPRPPRGKR